MKISDIQDYINRECFIVFVDDKVCTKLTAEYLENNTVAIAGTMEYGRDVCRRLQKWEREKFGRANTRYRIYSVGEKYVCSEDLEQETVIDIVEKIPQSPEDREMVIKHIRDRAAGKAEP